jgi:thiamine pyrophosphokinase
MAEERKICAVVGAAPIAENPFSDLDRNQRFIICADGGYDTLVKFGVVPDLLVGDFDSMQSEIPRSIRTIRLKREKDDTDFFVAVKEGIRLGFRDFELYGALGGERFDHSYANLCVLQYLCTQGCRAFISDGCRRVFLLCGGRITISGMRGAVLSVFPFGCAACEVSYIGMKYPLENATLSSEIPLGVSNEITEDTAQITVHSGNALIIVQK